MQVVPKCRACGKRLKLGKSWGWYDDEPPDDNAMYLHIWLKCDNKRCKLRDKPEDFRIPRYSRG